MKKSTLILLISTAIFFTSTLVLLYLNYLKPTPTFTPTTGTIPTDTPITTTNPTADWKEYINKQVSFSFKYPKTLLINSSNKNLDDTSLYIEVTKMSEIVDRPSGFTKEAAYQDMASLSKGNYGNKVAFPVNGSEKVFEIGDIKGKTYSSFSNMDICGVVFARTAILYRNNYQIIINYLGPQSLSKQLGAYMTTDPSNCGTSLIWKDSQGFYQDLLTGQAPKEIQEWYSNFDQILSTFKFIDQKQESALDVAKKYLDAYVSQDWTTAKQYSSDPNFDEAIAEGYAFVKYTITGQKADTKANYYHVYVSFTDKNGEINNKAPYSNGPLEVLMFKDSSGQWKALTWYFYP